MLTLALAYWAVSLLVLAFLVVCVVLILIVLIQRPQGGGLSGAFGAGGGSGQTAFGTKTGDALTIATISIFVLFLLFGVGLNFAARPASITGGPTVAGPADAPQTGAGVAPDTASTDPATDAPDDALPGTDDVSGELPDVEEVIDDAADDLGAGGTGTDQP
jgi:preprotein translocase subunit SecG